MLNTDNTDNMEKLIGDGDADGGKSLSCFQKFNDGGLVARLFCSCFIEGSGNVCSCLCMLLICIGQMENDSRPATRQDIARGPETIRHENQEEIQSAKDGGKDCGRFLAGTSLHAAGAILLSPCTLFSCRDYGDDVMCYSRQQIEQTPSICCFGAGTSN